MNTKQVLIALAVVTAMSATAVMAQNDSAPAPAAQESGRKGKEKFQDRKANVLERLSKSAAKIQEKQACVQAATDAAALDKCVPKRGKGKGRWHKRGGGKVGAENTGAASTPAPAEK